MKKDVAPKVSVKGGVQSAKGERLIVIDAITSHGPLRHEPLTALWAYEYNKKGDYHDAMNFDKFQRWINDYFIPTWRASFPH